MIKKPTNQKDISSLVLELERDLDVFNMLLIARDNSLFERSTINKLEASTVSHMMELCESIKIRIA